MLGRAIRRESERGGEVEPDLQQRYTALQVEERRPSADRQDLDLKLAPAYFVGAVLLQWVVGRLTGQSIGLWPLASGALLATLAGICVAHLLRQRGASPGLSEGGGSAFAALLAVMTALTYTGS